MPKTMAPAKPNPAAPKPAAVMQVPFMRGAVDHAEPFYDTTFTLSANQQNIGPVDLPAYGFARAVWFDIQLVSAGNAAAVALQEDAPWVTLAELAIQDLNGSPIFGPHGGHECYLHHKYGGFRNQRDPKLAPNFVAILAGAGATAGSGRYQFRVNIERSARDGLGALADMNASQAYKMRAVLNTLANIFSTAPTAAPTVRIRAWLEAYSQPNDTDPVTGRPAATVPPANGTTGYSSRIQPVTVAQANTVKHTRVGNYIRNLIYTNRRAGTSRANGETDIAGINWQWFIDARLLTNMTTEMIRARLSEQYNLISTTLEGAGGPDNGVLALPFMTEFSGLAGYEMRDNWLPTSQATRLELLITLPNAGVLTVMTDDVAPKGNVFLT